MERRRGAEASDDVDRGHSQSTAGPFIFPLLAPFILAAMFMKVPPNKALLVRSKRGDRRVLRVVLGGAVTVNPLTETTELLETGVRTLDHVFKGVLTGVEGVGLPIDIRTSLNVTIVTSRGLTPERAELLLRLPAETFNAMVVEAVSKRLREACALYTPDDLDSSRELVAGWVLRAAARDLEPVGVDLRALAIRDLEDERGYLDAVRKERMMDYLTELEEQREREARGRVDTTPPPPGSSILHQQTFTQRFGGTVGVDGGGPSPGPRAQEWQCPGCHRSFTPEEVRALVACPRCGMELPGQGPPHPPAETQGEDLK